MSKTKRNDIPEGYGKLLDQWAALENSGDPVGCVATSFTFSPAFFEEECLGRFLDLKTDAVEDGPLYLVEREEKLAQVVCAAALVDQHNCKGSRSLRWDLHPARVSGILHAKISLLCWSNLVRLIIASANLTEDGYRRNQEVLGVLDYKEGTEAPRQVLANILAYLREMMRASQPDMGNKAVDRWYAFLDQVESKTVRWGETADEHARRPLRVETILTGPGRLDVFKQLMDAWPAGSPPHTARVVSPFFDPPEAENRPAKAIWELMRKRGDAEVNYCLAMDEVFGEKRFIARAPESLITVKRPREATRVVIQRLKLDNDRPLHAKELLFEDDRFVLLMTGSSNFTSAGLGLGKTMNYEANLAYILDANRAKGGYNDLMKRFPDSDAVKDVQFESVENVDEKSSETVVLPSGFKSVTYRLKDGKTGEVVFELGKDLPADWQLLTEDEKSWQNATDWVADGKPSSWVKPWPALAPSGIWVAWPDAHGMAWWPVNVESSTDLPPPKELKDLPLEILINLLTSARPLHEVLRRYLRKKKDGETILDTSPGIDPHKNVDTREFLLQRTRRFSWALNSLRQRLERPVSSEECLSWRITGPVGVMAVAKALEREAKSTEERSFLMAELALELTRVRSTDTPGYLPAARVRKVLLETAQDLCRMGDFQGISAHKHLQMYLSRVHDHVEEQRAGV